MRRLGLFILSFSILCPRSYGDRIAVRYHVNRTVDDRRPGASRLVDYLYAERLRAFADQAAIAIENAGLYQGEREQRELAEALCDFGATLTSASDMHMVLERLLEQVGRVVLNDAIGIMLIGDEGASIVHWRGHEQFGIKDLAQTTFQITSTRYLKQMLMTGEPVVGPDTDADPNGVHLPGIEWLRSFAAVPIRMHGEVIGFLNAASATPGFLGPKQAMRLHAFADQAAVALENVRLFEEAQKSAERLQLLSRRLVEVQERTSFPRPLAMA